MTTTTATAPAETDRAQSADAITRKLQHAERAVQEARRSLLEAVKLVEANESDPRLKTSTMRSLIGSLDIASVPLGMEARAWDQYTTARRSPRF